MEVFFEKSEGCLNRDNLCSQQGRGVRPNLYALRLLALAWKDSQSTGACSQEQMRLYAKQLGFEYSNFSQHKKELCQQLKNFGVNLLFRASDGDGLYLKTIQYYSGKIYIKFIQDVLKAKREKTWEELLKPGVITEIIRPRIDGVRRHVDENEERDEITAVDVEEFFRALIERFLETNTALTAEDVCAIHPLPTAVAGRIIKALSPEDGCRLEEMEILPKLTIRDEELGFELPQEGGMPNNLQSPVVFRIYDNGNTESYKWLRYKRNNDERWILDERTMQSNGWSNFFDIRSCTSIKRVARIEKRENDGNVEVLLDEVEVLPRFFAENDSVVVKRYEKNEVRFVDSEHSTLRVGDNYCICGKNSAHINAEYITEDEQKKGIVNTECWLTIPFGATELVVNDTHYEVDALSQIIDPVARIPWFSPRDYGGRKFVEWSDNPSDYLSAACVDAGYEQIRYFVDGVEVPLSFNTCLWKKGSLVLIHGEECKRVPVTFIDQIDWGETFDNPVRLGANINPCISIDGQCIQDLIIDAQKGVVSFDYERNGIQWHILRKYDQYGVSFVLKEAGEQIIIPEERPVLDVLSDGTTNIIPEISRRDFGKMKCGVTTNDANCTVILTCGNRQTNLAIDNTQHLSHDLFRLSESDSELRLTDSSDYCICILSERTPRFHKFHVYDPILKSVVWDFSATGNLTVVYYSSFSDKGGDKYIACVPTHKQDSHFTFIRADEVRYEVDEKNRLKCFLSFNNFAEVSSNANVEWGLGLICFVTNKNEGKNIPIASRGFYIPNQDDQARVPVSNDNLNDLRAAIAEREVDAITRIMCQGDRHEEIGGFIDNMTECMKKLDAFSYLNSYRSCLTNQDGTLQEVSGYVFMADWYFADKFSRGLLPLPYRGKWDPLMFGWNVRSQPLSGVEGLFDSCFQDLIQLNAVLQVFEQIDIKHQKWLSDECLNFRLIAEATNNGEILCFKRITNYFTYAQISEALRLMAMQGETGQEVQSAIQSTYERWMKYYHQNEDNARDTIVYAGFNVSGDADLNQVYAFVKSNAEPYLFYAGYPFIRLISYDEEYSLSSNALKRYLQDLGRRLYEWRNNPVLNKESNQLRETLLYLREIDCDIEGWLPENLPPNLSPLRTLVDTYAFELKTQEERND